MQTVEQRVSQRARDAAASIEPNGRERDQILRGKRDKSAIVQAFARFEASLPPSAPVDAERERGPRCENCLKPIEVGQVVLCYDDAGEMHADCEHPYSVKHEQGEGEPAPVVLLGDPMVHVPLAALALPPSGIVEMVREMCAAKADETRVRFGSPTGSAYDNGLWDQSVRIASAIRSLDLPGIADAWQPIETAPYDQAVEVKVGGMTMLAKLLYRHSENEHGSCDQWVAVNEGEHPPCWSGGACWESNEDEVTSLQPTHWRPAPPADLSNKGVG